MFASNFSRWTVHAAVQSFLKGTYIVVNVCMKEFLDDNIRRNLNLAIAKIILVNSIGQ